MPVQDSGQAGALREAEALIAKWDGEGGLTYRDLALKIARAFGVEMSKDGIVKATSNDASSFISLMVCMMPPDVYNVRLGRRCDPDIAILSTGQP
jgi:hypothetical protein